MKLRNFLLLITLATAFAWGVLGWVVSAVNPFTASWFGFLLFYTSLLLAIISSVLTLGVLMRVFLRKRRVVEHAVIDSLRQSIFISVLVVLLLVFLSQQLLTWWNFLLLLCGLVLVEIFFVVSQKRFFEEEHPEE